jgi:hypothetical protein
MESPNLRRELSVRSESKLSVILSLRYTSDIFCPDPRKGKWIDSREFPHNGEQSSQNVSMVNELLIRR